MDLPKQLAYHRDEERRSSVLPTGNCSVKMTAGTDVRVWQLFIFASYFPIIQHARAFRFFSLISLYDLYVQKLENLFKVSLTKRFSQFSYFFTFISN